MNSSQPESSGCLPTNFQPVPADWRDQLVLRLEQRPRRLGTWAELALYGALQCLDAHGIDRMSAHTVLRVACTFGPTDALLLSWQSCASANLPMPFDFLQSQPSQMLAALSQYLQWQGDASFVAHDNFAALETIFQNEANALQHQTQQLNKPLAGLLYGYVDLKPVPISHWRLIA